MDGGSRVAELLKAHGVRHLFALAGGHISPILVQCKRLGVRVIDTRHEVNAVFAADAMARITGVPGVAAVTAGPGVSNSITAVKNAMLAQSPMVLIGGATATILRGRGSLQDIDQVALMEPNVKWVARPNTLREVVPALRRAFEVCQSGLPGPVFVELAMDLLYPESRVREMHLSQVDKPNKSLLDRAISTYVRGHLGYRFALSGNPDLSIPSPVEVVAPSFLAIDRAAVMLREARRPVMVIGSQAMLRAVEIKSLVEAVERLGVPVYLSGMARGLLGAGHRLHMRHKRRLALKAADVVLLCGVPNDFRLDYGSHVARAKLISANLSEQDLTKNRRPNVGVLADPHAFVCALSNATSASSMESSWLEQLAERDCARDAEIAELAEQPSERLNPLKLCQAIEGKLTEGSVVIGDGGDFIGTAAYVVRPRGPYGWLDPGVFGTLGVGAGFALGAKLVNPGSDVWLLYGDGASGFSIMEQDTFARHGIGVISVVGNDACWSQIARDQVGTLGDDVGCSLTYMDYHVVARGCGAEGLLVRHHDELDDVLSKAVEISRTGKPVLVNALMDRSDFRKGSISV